MTCNSPCVWPCAALFGINSHAQLQHFKQNAQPSHDGAWYACQFSLNSFCCRFIKTSGKIVDKMGSNLGQIATTAKQAADKVGEQIWGKGRDH